MLTDRPAFDRQSASFDRHWAELSKVLGEDYAAITMIDQGTLSDGFRIAQLGDPGERLIRFHEAVEKVVGSGTR